MYIEEAFKIYKNWAWDYLNNVFFSTFSACAATENDLVPNTAQQNPSDYLTKKWRADNPLNEWNFEVRSGDYKAKSVTTF